MTYTSFKPTGTTDFKPRIPKPNPKGCLIGFIAFIIVVALSVLIGMFTGL